MLEAAVKRAKRIALIVGLLVFTVASDQLSKAAARASLPEQGIVRVVGSVIILTYAENTGAFLGFGSTWPGPARALVFGLLSALIVAAAVIYLFVDRDMPGSESVAFSLIAGGGIGNMIDRILRSGAVTDFLNIGIGRVRTGIFNLADLYLMIGIGVLVVTAYAARGAKK